VSPIDEPEDLRWAIRDATDPMVVMRRVVDEALMLIPAADGSVVEVADEAHLTYVCAAGTLAASVGTRLRRDNSLSGLSIRTAATLHCLDAAVDDRVDRDACLRVGAVSMVCVPLNRQGDPVGVLKVTASRPEAFGGEDVATLTRLADFVTAAITAASELDRATGELLSPSGKGELVASSREGDGVGEFVANVLRPGIVASMETRHRIERVLAGSNFAILCQPVIDLDSGALIGAEALSRFSAPPSQGPDVWFDEAHQVGLGVALELAAVRMALGLIDDLPPQAYMAVNLGPEAISVPELEAMLGAADGRRVVLELTEHLKVDDYEGLGDTLRAIRSRGVRLAIDDTGAGFASLAHILKLAPDIIKLDRALTGGIDHDPVRRALAGALVTFAAETGATVIAEGIETADELDAVRKLGIPHGQGYLLGRPAPIASLGKPVARTG
jgi:EAL domain-containing protein (putative c-di-GMP-specific phosphodiesterase class I)